MRLAESYDSIGSIDISNCLFSFIQYLSFLFSQKIHRLVVFTLESEQTDFCFIFIGVFFYEY